MTAISTSVRAVTAVGGTHLRGASPLSIPAGIERLEALGPNWDGRGSDCPNAHALRIARRFGDLLEDLGLIPDRISASPDGGVAFYFFPADGPEESYVAVEALNEGGVVGTSREGGELVAWEFPEDDLEGVLQKVEGCLES